MRLFIAIPIPEDIKDYLESIQEKHLKKRGVFANKHFHLTLQFLGDEIEETQLLKIKEALKKTFESSMPDKNFLFQLKHIETFKNRFKQIRVIWIGLKISKSLLDFQKSLEKYLAEVDFKNDKNFMPHLTLARVKLPKTSILEKQVIKIPVEEKMFEANQIHLIQTLLKPEGASYKVIEKYIWEEAK